MHIPSTIQEATDALAGIESLLTKKGWERAAIVAAFVRLPGSGGDHRASVESDVWTAGRFASLGIKGLVHEPTIRAYVKAWLDAHDGIYPEPGAEVIMPDLPWPPTGTPTSTNTPTKAIQTAVRNGTLLDALTDEQKVEVAASIIEEATADPSDREMLGKIEEAADIAPVTTMETMRTVIRTNKERDALTTPIREQVPHLKRILTYLDIECGQDTELWQGVYDHAALRLAEHAVDGRINGVRS